MSQSSTTSFERISEEAHGDVFSFLSNGDNPFADLDFDLFSDESNPIDFPIAGTCDYTHFTGRINLMKNKTLFDCCYIESLVNSVEPNELDGYLGPCNSQSKNQKYNFFFY